MVDNKSYRLKLPDAGLAQEELPGSPWGKLIACLKGDESNSMCWRDIYSLAKGELQGMFTPMTGCYEADRWFCDYNYYSSRMIGWRPVLEELKTVPDLTGMDEGRGRAGV